MKKANTAEVKKVQTIQQKAIIDKMKNLTATEADDEIQIKKSKNELKEIQADLEEA